jgi:hypothetical protein
MTIYEQLRKDSTISWHKLYAEEREKRKEIEIKYKFLAEKIQEFALEEKNKIKEK